MYLKALLLILYYIILWWAGYSESNGLGISTEYDNETQIPVSKRFYTNCDGLQFEEKYNILPYSIINCFHKYGCAYTIKAIDSYYKCKDNIFYDQFGILTKNTSLCLSNGRDCWYFIGKDSALVIIKCNSQYYCYTTSVNYKLTLDNLQFCSEIESLPFALVNQDVLSCKEAELKNNGRFLNTDEKKYYSGEQNISSLGNVHKRRQYTCRKIQFEDSNYVLDDNVLSCISNDNYECWHIVNNSFSQMIINCNNKYYCYNMKHYKGTLRLGGICRIKNLEEKQGFLPMKKRPNYLSITCNNQTYCYFPEQSSLGWTLISTDAADCNEHHRRARSEPIKEEHNTTAWNDPDNAKIIKTDNTYSQENVVKADDPAAGEDYLKCDSKVIEFDNKYQYEFKTYCKVPLKDLECHFKYEEETAETYLNIRCNNHYYVFLYGDEKDDKVVVSGERWEEKNIENRENPGGTVGPITCQDKVVYADKDLLTNDTLTCLNTSYYVCTYYKAHAWCDEKMSASSRRRLFDKFEAFHTAKRKPNGSVRGVLGTLKSMFGLVEEKKIEEDEQDQEEAAKSMEEHKDIILGSFLSDFKYDVDYTIIGCKNTFWCFSVTTGKNSSVMTVKKHERLINCLNVDEWEWTLEKGPTTYYGKIIFASVGVILCCSGLALFVLAATLIIVINIAQL